jgi:hypothetical protein
MFSSATWTIMTRRERCGKPQGLAELPVTITHRNGPCLDCTHKKIGVLVSLMPTPTRHLEKRDHFFGRHGALDITNGYPSPLKASEVLAHTSEHA